MKKFLIKSAILSFSILVVHFGLAFFADGFTDPYYSKFSDKEQNSMIFGASRASEGLMPSVIDSITNGSGKNISMFNFAFTNSDSPYGPVYLNAIKKKLNPNEKNGIFILSVQPWNISSLCENPNDVESFRENVLVLNQMSNFSSSPNVDYLVNSYSYGWGNLLLKKAENGIFNYLGEHTKFKSGLWAYVHDDGWLEVKSLLEDSIKLNERLNIKIEKFKSAKINHEYRFSSKRMEYLHAIISELKSHGTVVLIRLPIHKELVRFENDFMPSFDSLINEIAVVNSVEYLNYVNESENYNYSDGHHLDGLSAEKLSVNVARLLINK